MKEQLSLMLRLRLGCPELTPEFDLNAIEALQEDENRRVQRKAEAIQPGNLGPETLTGNDWLAPAWLE